jgi:hypothetical protein
MHAELWAETVGPFTSSNGVVAASITAIPCTTAAEPLLRQPPKRQNRNRSRKRKDKSQSRVPVTALIAGPTFHSEVKQQVANQMAAPAETRTPNMHRANESLLESADGSMATAATRREIKTCSTKTKN